MRASNVKAGSLREMQRRKIKQFIKDNRYLLEGRVLDYGCGDMPYAKYVPGKYTGWNRAEFPGTPHRVNIGPDEPLFEEWDAIICTQMLQYVPNPQSLLWRFRGTLMPGEGVLLLTVQTNWAEVENEDIHRFTKAGTWKMLVNSGFTVEVASELGRIEFDDEYWALGYGFVARAC